MLQCLNVLVVEQTVQLLPLLTIQLIGNTCIVLKSPGSSETVSLLKEDTFIVFVCKSFGESSFLYTLNSLEKELDAKQNVCWHTLKDKSGIDDVGCYNLWALLET